jgi:uncharacterized membrane protein YraQ (UPF0718 family)
MLCSCCASPVFSAVYERSRRLSPSLALMLASPGMNPASLALCFMLFPTQIAAARVLIASVSSPLVTNALPVEPEALALREAFFIYRRSVGMLRFNDPLDCPWDPRCDASAQSLAGTDLRISWRGSRSPAGRCLPYWHRLSG